MLHLFIKNKFIFYPLLIIFLPFIFVWSIFYGVIVGFIGGIVWGIERGVRFLASGTAKRTVAPYKIRFLHKVLIVYIFSMISIIAGIVCVFIGPFRAYRKFTNRLVNGRIKRAKIGRHPLVMVVDDEPELAESIANKIRSTGKYETVVAHNGLEALKQVDAFERFLGIAENRIGCIVLDIKMPEMDGLTFLKELRKKEGALFFSESGSFHRMPVIILSAYEDIEKITDATHPRLGQVVKYIIKPERVSDLSELMSAVDSVFANKEQDMIISAYLSGNFRIHELKKE